MTELIQSRGLWQVLFWMSLFLLAYATLGYALLLRLLNRGQSTDAAPAERTPGQVSVVLVVHNESARILPRLQNLLASDYPKDQLEIIVVSDGSGDDTARKVKELGSGSVRLIEREQRTGKAGCLNAGVAAARGEFVVFADARQEFAPGAIRALVRCFANPRIGAVSGELQIKAAGSAVGAGVDAYWRLEKMIRQAEADMDSTIGCTGAIYAIRRELYEPVPDDTILDDVVIPMRIAAKGFRVGFEPAAVAWDPQALEADREEIRKRRTLAGNFQMLFRYPEWLMPWSGRLWWQLASHKYLRLAGPFLMGATAAANLLLAAIPFYRCTLMAQMVFYGCALAGLAFPGLRLRVLSLPAGFVFLNAMVVAGLWHYLRGTYQTGAWQKAAASPAK